jgi:hypothetical protein
VGAESVQLRRSGGAASVARRHNVRPAAAADGPGRVGKKTQTYTFSGCTRLRGLQFCENWCFIDLGAKSLARLTVSVSCRREPEPSECLTLGILSRLEDFCAQADSPAVMAHLLFYYSWNGGHFAVGILFCTFACLRFQQAQFCWITKVLAEVGEANVGARRSETFACGRPGARDSAVPWLASSKGEKCTRFPRDAVRKHGFLGVGGWLRLLLALLLGAVECLHLAYELGH